MCVCVCVLLIIYTFWWKNRLQTYIRQYVKSNFINCNLSKTNFEVWIEIDHTPVLIINHQLIGIFLAKYIATTCRPVWPTGWISSSLGSTFNTRQHCSSLKWTHNQCRKTDRPDLIKNWPTFKRQGEHETPKVLIIPRNLQQQRIDKHWFLTPTLRFKLALDTMSSRADVIQRLLQMGASCPRRSGR